MPLVQAPLPAAPQHPMRASVTVHAMQVGQHLIMVLLTLVGAIRAVNAGESVFWVSGVSLALLTWHAAGSLIPAIAVSPRRRGVWLLGFAGVWIIAVAVSAEFVWLAFLLWLLAGHLFSLVTALLFSVAVFVVTQVAPVLHHGTIGYANVIGPLIGGVFAFGISRGYLQLLTDAAERERLLASLTRAQTEMADLQDELAHAQRQAGTIAERTRIARDLHDTVAQTLSSMKLLAHAAEAEDPTPGAQAALTRIAALAGESLSDVRRIVASLAPAELEQGSLTAALTRMLDRMHDEAGIAGRLIVDATLSQLPAHTEIALLRTAQSALANVTQHAHATRVTMNLIDAGDSVRLDIVDDGTGFDAQSWEGKAPETSQQSFGLRFMRERLRELGGGLDIESGVGRGTAVSAHIPLQRVGRSTSWQ